MSLAATPDSLAASRAAAGSDYVRAGFERIMHWLVSFWIFSGGIILFEPAPYELIFVLAFSAAILAGLKLHRANLALLLVICAFVPFALIGAFQARHTPTSDALIFVTVTIFLMITGYFVANYVAEDPVPRMRRIVVAYTWIAVISALLGTLAYLGVLPGKDLFLRYGRAKAMFKDPNVFAPFLILPAMYALQRLLLANQRKAVWAAGIFMVIFIGVFASFSRAAWGHILASALMVFCLCFWLEAHAREKVRMLILALTGLGLMLVALVGLLSIPSVYKLFEQRASVTQEYDTGESGRFGRQGYAFDLALQNPWGIGPLEFRNLRIDEEPHDTYVNVLHVYGWGGGAAFIAVILLTLWKGFAGLARPGPNRLLLIPLVSTFLPLAIEAAIIDIDHWRHFFLVAGLIWGVTASRKAWPKGSWNKKASLV